MTLSIVPFYAAVLALVLVALSVRVIGLRRRKGVALGTRRDIELVRATRAHANFVEYVPMALLLLSFVEMISPPQFVHVLGIALIVGRLAHAYGVSREPEDFRYRVTGMSLTFTVLAGASLLIIASTLARFA